MPNSLKKLSDVLNDKSSLLSGGKRRRKSSKKSSKKTSKRKGGRGLNPVMKEYQKLQAFIRLKTGIKAVKFVSKFMKLYTDAIKKANPSIESLKVPDLAMKAIEKDVDGATFKKNIEKIKVEINMK